MSHTPRSPVCLSSVTRETALVLAPVCRPDIRPLAPPRLHVFLGIAAFHQGSTASDRVDACMSQVSTNTILHPATPRHPSPNIPTHCPLTTLSLQRRHTRTTMFSFCFAESIALACAAALGSRRCDQGVDRVAVSAVRYSTARRRLGSGTFILWSRSLRAKQHQQRALRSLPSGHRARVTRYSCKREPLPTPVLLTAPNRQWPTLPAPPASIYPCTVAHGCH